jgi:cytochrome b561
MRAGAARPNEIVMTPAAPSAPQRRHHALSIALHWTSALAVLTAFAVAWTRAALDDAAPRAVLMAWHQGAGLLVLALLLLRVGVRLATFRAVAAPTLPPAMKVAALATHVALYAALLAMPLLGWALTNAHGHDVSLPGLPPFPPLVATDVDLAETLESWHEGLAWALAGVVVLHAGAALFHHFVRRDDVLRAMLPAPAARRRSPPAPRPGPPAQGSRSF